MEVTWFDVVDVFFFFGRILEPPSQVRGGGAGSGEDMLSFLAYPPEPSKLISGHLVPVLTVMFLRLLSG